MIRWLNAPTSKTTIDTPYSVQHQGFKFSGLSFLDKTKGAPHILLILHPISKRSGSGLRSRQVAQCSLPISFLWAHNSHGQRRQGQRRNEAHLSLALNGPQS